MYCSNCGKQIKDEDNFCRYCGADLRSISYIETPEETLPVKSVKIETPAPKIDESEELVLYDVKKHWMSLFWSAFFTPVFFIYFWCIFLNTHSFFSWVVVFTILVFIVYPVLRYNSDKIIITNKFVHIKTGVLNSLEKEIPLDELNILEVTQSVLGRIFNYGMVSFNVDSDRYDWGYIQTPEDLEYIIENPEKFVEESMHE